jgi:hypothetical protein
MSRKYKNPKKPNIVSVRVTDEEMATVQQLMDATSKRASDLMREALLLFTSELKLAAMAETSLDSKQVASC